MWLDPGLTGYLDEKFKDIASKVLLIRGDEDHLTTLESQTEMKRMLPGTKLLNLTDVGHEVQLIEPELCFKTISKFLGK